MAKRNIETQEELGFIKKVESGEYEALDKRELENMKSSLKEAATNTIKKLSKRKAISVRLLEDDIEKLKAISLNEGMPYQTYIASIIHKVVTGQVKSL